MGVQVYESEYTSTVGPARLFKALILDADNLIPKIAPQAIESVELLERDGGPGTIKKIKFGAGSSFGFVKHRVDAIDADNFFYAYTMFEGDALTEKIVKIEYETKLVETADGCTIKNVSKYHTIGEIAFLEDQIKAGKEKASQLFKLIEAYLKEHLDAYN